MGGSPRKCAWRLCSGTAGPCSLASPTRDTRLALHQTYTKPPDMNATLDIRRKYIDYGSLHVLRDWQERRTGTRITCCGMCM